MGDSQEEKTIRFDSVQPPRSVCQLNSD